MDYSANYSLVTSLLIIVLVLANYSICNTSASLHTIAISRTAVCALISYQQQTAATRIRCYDVSSRTSFNILPNISFSGIASTDDVLCGVRASNNAVLCWDLSNTTSTKRIFRGAEADDGVPVITDLEAGRTEFCALNTEGKPHCWRWPGFDDQAVTAAQIKLVSFSVGDGFFCGVAAETGRPICYGDIRNTPRDLRIVYVTAGIHRACGVTIAGNILCWGNSKTDDIGLSSYNSPFEFDRLAIGGDNDDRICGWRGSNRTVACWGSGGFRLPESLHRAEFVEIYARGNLFCGVHWTNYSVVCWNERNNSWPAFDSVLPGPCISNESTCPCGSLAGAGRLCPLPGQSICQPCELVNNPNQTTTTPISPSPNPTVTNPSQSRSRFSQRQLVAFVVVGSVGSAVGLVTLCFCAVLRICGHGRGGSSRVHDSGPLDDPTILARPSTVGIKRSSLARTVSSVGTLKLEEFSAEFLAILTNNFSLDHRIGTGSFGSVYEAVLDDGRHVAIKRAEKASNSLPPSSRAAQSSIVRQYRYNSYDEHHHDNEQAFAAELGTLSRLNHKNVVQLYGFCDEEDERMLVFELMPNGTISDHLHKILESPFHSWIRRIEIALDAARGIEYLHSYATPPIIHRDIKSSNILLDANWHAKISDFGLSLMGQISSDQDSDSSSHLSTRAAGTVGYMDPEYYRLQRLSKKSDVYSFGVVLLELLTGYKAIHRDEEEGGGPRNVVDFVVPYVVTDQLHQVLDLRVPPPTPCEIEAVVYVGYLAADCVNLEGKDRPSMGEVVGSLEKALAACLQRIPVSRTGSSLNHEQRSVEVREQDL